MYPQHLLFRTRLVWRASTAKALARWRILIILAALGIGCAYPGRAQHTPQIPATQNPELLPASFLPKSPTAVPFIRFDEPRNVDLITGAAQASIPLTEVSSGELHLPVSLGYSYSGLKVFQTQDLVGLGWSLQAGGSITRQINGMPDELMLSYGPYSSQTVLKASQEGDQGFFKAALNQDVDTAPDIYSFSVAGYSGRFTIQQGLVTLLPAQPLRIERLSAKGEFQITTEAGVRYVFAITETTIPNPNNFGKLGAHASTWHLTQAISAGNADTIRLHYTKAAYREPAHCVMTSGQLFPSWIYGTFSECTSSPYTWRNITPIPPVIQAQYLDSISSAGARIVFTRQAGTHILQQVRLLALSPTGRRPVKTFVLTHSFFPGISPADKRLRLESVQERNGTSSLPPYRFSYTEGDMPPTNSLALDYWGYYNGATLLTSNSELVIANIIPALLWDPQINTLGFSPPQNIAAKRHPNAAYASHGALRKIIYPTGGSTAFEYEGADYPLAVPLQIERSRSCNLTCHTDGRPLNTCLDTFSLPQLSAAHLKLTREPSTQAGSGNSGQTNHVRDFNLKLRRPNGTDSLVTDGILESFYQTFDNTSVREYDYMLPRGNYILEVYCEPYERETTVNVDIAIPPLLQRNAPGPGIRVRQTTSVATGSPPLIQTYDYSTTDAMGSYSTGKLVGPTDAQGVPIYDQQLFTIVKMQGLVVTTCKFLNTSSDIAPLGSENDKYPFFYQRVTERRQSPDVEAGVTISDFQAEPLLFNDVQLSQRRVYRHRAGKPLQLAQREATLFYTGPEQLYHAMRARQVSSSQLPATDPPELYTGDNYGIKVAFVAPRQTIRTQYDEDGDSLTTITNAGYQNHRLARTTTQTGTGWQVNRYKYLTEYNRSAPGAAALNGPIYFDPLVETQTWRTFAESKDSILVGGHLTIYDAQWRKPLSTWSLRLAQPQAGPDNELIANGLYQTVFSDSHYQQDASGSYDSGSGRLVQQQITYGPSTAYVWGYNRTYPVAQVENATAAEVLQILGPATLAQLQGPAPGPDAQVQQLLLPLRTHLPRAKVTTCTFLPLVGLTSLTDATGRISFFEYDDLGRLLRSRDEQNRLLTQQEYHYARP